MKKIRFGIVGTGNIGHRFAEAIKNVEEAELVAVASRKQETADAFADEFSIPIRFSSYEAMAKSDEIDFAYIALPHSFHCEASCLMMNNGKNVICEKPMAVNEKQGIEMFECAKKNNVFLMEAMWARLVPGTVKLMSLVSDGVIGEPRGVECKFCYAMDDELDHHIFKNENGGGSLLDVGVYGLHFAKWYLGEKVTDLSAYADMYENTDSHLCALLKYESGAIADISSATLLRKPNEGYIYGKKGYIHMERFYAPQRLEIHLNDGREEIIEAKYKGNGFEEQIAHCCECINIGLKESPINTAEATLFVLRQMDEIRKKIGLTYPQDR